MNSEYLYIDDESKIVASLSIDPKAVKQPYEIAVGLKHLAFPHTYVYLKVFNQ